MTLNELIKAAAGTGQPQTPQAPKPISTPAAPKAPAAGTQPKPATPTTAAMTTPTVGTPQQPSQVNQYGFSRNTYNIPQQYSLHQNADGTVTKFNEEEYIDWQNSVKAWEAQRRADLEAQGIQLTDANKHLWNHAAAWNYINQQRGAAQDTGRAWYKPRTWFEDAPEEFRNATTNYDPVEMEAAKARSQGYQRGTQQDIVLNRATNAKFLNRFVDKYINKAIGDQANKANAEFAQELRNMGLSYEEAADTVAASNAEYLGQDIPYLGKALGFAVDLGTSAFGSGAVDTFLFGQAAKGVGLAGKGLVNVGGKFVPAIGKATSAMSKVTSPAAKSFSSFATKHPHLAAGGKRFIGEFGPASLFTSFGEPIVTGEITRDHPEIGMALGISPNRQAEAWERAVYTDDYYNQVLTDRPLISAKPSADGSYQRLTYLDTENGGDKAENYGAFRQWAEDTGNLDKMDDLEVQKQWVKQYMADGSSMYTVMMTPMYQNQSAEDKAQLATDLLMNRVKATQNTAGLAWDKHVKGMTGAEILSEAMKNDTTGALNNLMTGFLANNDADTIVQFIEQNMGNVTGKNTGADVSTLYNTFRDGLVMNLVGNPDSIPGTMNALLNLQNAKSQAGLDLSGSQGANAIKMAFGQALADPSTVNDMSDESLFQLAEMFATNGKMAGGMDSLGPQGAALADAAEQNIRGRIRESFFNNPLKNGPKIASLWFASKGFGDLAQLASNPWVFYSVALALLGGGALLLSSGLDSDDDDDEKDSFDRALDSGLWS